MPKSAIFFILIFAILFDPVSAQNKSQIQVRDFFKLIPNRYFSVSCCDGNKDEFIKKNVSVEDKVNYYMEGQDFNADPKYAGFQMRVFKRQNGQHLITLRSHSINWDDYYFLEYKAGKLINISKSIPRYSVENIYEFPRASRIIKVYQKKYDSPKKILSVDYAVQKGKHLYNLVWENENFVVRPKQSR